MQTAVEKILRNCGAILDGHFLFTSGRHGNRYLEKAEICANPSATVGICWMIAHSAFRQQAFGGGMIDVVVGLAPIGAVLSNRVAEYLKELYQQSVISIFAEKDEQNKMVFKRGYASKVVGKNVLIVDDILTTGGSIGQVKREIERLGGKVVGAVVICQRGEVRSEDLAGTPLIALAKFEMKDWAPEECPLCKEGVPPINPKSR